MSGPDEARGNTPPPFEGVNLYASDTVLREAVAREGGGLDESALQSFGARVGSSDVAEWAAAAHRHVPVLHRFDRWGEPRDAVEYHPAYHAMMRLGIEAGTVAAAWDGTRSGHVVHAALEFLLAQVEPSACCPITMSYAAPAALKHAPETAREWLPRLLARRYDPSDAPASSKAGVTLGMAMTEKQGGSDVRANVTRAEPAGNVYLLTGHKWFCSAPMSDAFLTLAQAPGGLTCFLAPRWKPDGTRNAIRVIRLKDKIGDRANASSEIEYHGAEAIRIGEEGRGIATILDMVHHTRFDCMIAPAAYMRGGLAQALWHCARRHAFGKPLLAHPLMRQVLADLALEAEAASVLVFRVARAFDRAAASEDERLFARIATPVGKYWLNKRVVPHVTEALECHGGAGYIEDWPIARLYRQAPLNGIWEGSGNIVCLDVLRALKRAPETAGIFLAHLNRAKGADAYLDAAIKELDTVFATSTAPEDNARRLVETMALALQGSLLVQHAPSHVAGSFCAARLGQERAAAYGASRLDASAVDAVLARAAPGGMEG